MFLNVSYSNILIHQYLSIPEPLWLWDFHPVFDSHKLTGEVWRIETVNLGEPVWTYIEEFTICPSQVKERSYFCYNLDYLKSVPIQSFSSPCCPVLSPNTEKYGPENSEYEHFSLSDGNGSISL